MQRTSKFIADRYEPVDAGMCVRLTNIQQLREIRAHVLYRAYNRAMQRSYEQLIGMRRQGQDHTLPLFQHYKMVEK